MRLRVLVIVFVLIFTAVIPSTSIEAASEHYLKFEDITVEQGLSQNCINAINQDHYGYIWFGTAIGLNRYDGVKFKVYVNDPALPGSLSNSDIQSLYETGDGKLWVGTMSGLNIFNR
ncbi:MAG: hypothetical protein NWF04_00050, partial [Candidatus Bathyarchaeota archaeon]|nr:hypothetical protein [Candidatus Bathyarchaeota archaeon]